LKYEKNQYSEGFSICGLVIAGIFLYWGFNSLFNGFWFGIGHNPFNLWWLGFIWIFIGLAIISGQIHAISNRSHLRGIVKGYFDDNPNASVEEIAIDSGISIKDTQAIILDLKARGELRGKFSTKTGQLKTVIKDEQIVELQKQAFCPNCGTPVKEGSAIYCAYCGSRL
jgi:hypothetical protein